MGGGPQKSLVKRVGFRVQGVLWVVLKKRSPLKTEGDGDYRGITGISAIILLLLFLLSIAVITLSPKPLSLVRVLFRRV